LIQNNCVLKTTEETPQNAEAFLPKQCKSGNLEHFFHKNPLYELHWICFCCKVVTMSRKKNGAWYVLHFKSSKGYGGI
jgi:hypothetical protein